MGEDSDEDDDEDDSDEEEEEEDAEGSWIRQVTYLYYSYLSSRGVKAGHRRPDRDQLSEPAPNNLPHDYERSQLRRSCSQAPQSADRRRPGGLFIITVGIARY